MRGVLILPLLAALLMAVGCSTQPRDSSTKAAPPVASASSDPSPPASELSSEIPLTASEQDAVRPQIERNWNLAGSDECPLDKRKPIELLVYLEPDGTVTKVEAIGDLSADKCSRLTYEGAMRAIMISSPLKLPAGKAISSLRVRFSPAEVTQ
jgi:hypothetical protein